MRWFCLFMCSHIDTAGIYWPGCVAGSVQATLEAAGSKTNPMPVLWSPLASHLRQSEKNGCLAVRDLLGVTQQRKRPGLQRNQCSPCKLDTRGTVTFAMSLWESSISIRLWICLGGQATSAYLNSYWRIWVASAIMTKFRDPDTANARMLVCAIETGLGVRAWFGGVNLASSGL